MTDEGKRCVQRIGQHADPRITPAYTLVQELEHSFIVEYCGSWKLLPKDAYEVTK